MNPQVNRPMNIRIVAASAGTGKTYRLTQELDNAIAEKRARPDSIVATTFTKQAAAELVERARTKMLRSGRVMEAHQLLAARIGTVNSVCGSFVSDFAFELEMSPAVRVLDEAAAELEFRRALAGVVTDDIADKLESFKNCFDAQLDWRYEVRRIVEAARANGLEPERLAGCAQRSIDELDVCLGPCEDAKAIDGALAAALQAAAAAIDVQLDTTKTTAKYLELIRRCARDLPRDRMRWGNWASLVSEEPAKKSLAHAAGVQAVARRHIAHPAMRAKMHELIRGLFQVACDVLSAYQEHKARRGVIDFIDQETKALELLRRPDVRAELAGQLDLVLIDEFQDTSPIQLAIFLELASLAAESIWVGDPKQAIFGFRGTDPALMDAAIESLTSTTIDPDLVDQAVQAVSGGRLERLDTSYRSRPELVDVTSEIFAPAFAQQGIPPERTRLQAKLKVDQEPAGLGHSFEYWPLDPGRPGGVALADAVAAGVRDLLARAAPVRDRNDGTARPTRPSDVAVLCRTNKQCQWVADALAALGVPAVVPQMELLDTAEAKLLLAGLRLWVDPGDALAAAEVARLVSYPSDLDALVARVLDEPGAGAFRDDPAVAAILAARVRSPDLGPVAAVDAVIAAGELRALCAGWGNSAQRLANLDALRSHAVAYAAEAAAGGTAVTLVGLLRHLESMVDSWGWNVSRSDSQALRAGAEAVTLSTWHRAKGLEWPVTILFGLETLHTPQAHGTHVMTDRQGFDVADPLGGRWIRFWPNPYSNAIQNGPVKTAFQQSPAYNDLVARADREALRILYVGWTRARDRLILAVQRGKLKGGLVGKLATYDSTLIVEPPAAAATAGEAVVKWAGRDVRISVAPSAPAPAVAVERVAGTVTVGREPIARAPARMLPSAAVAVACSLGETVVLGERIGVRGGPDMAAVGNAVHGFLAADRPGLSADERLAMAGDILRRFGLAENIEAADVIEAGTRLWRWIDGRFGPARVHREWPVVGRLPGGTVLGGTADLVLRTTGGVVVIDHKTFPGMDNVALERASSYSGQLAAYQGAICAATGEAAASTWVHFPVLGRVVEVCLAPVNA